MTLDRARGVASSQRDIVSAGRFGIPAIVHEECLTGLAAWQATVFPAPLSWAPASIPTRWSGWGLRSGPPCACSECTRVSRRCSTSRATCGGAASRRPSARTRHADLTSYTGRAGDRIVDAGDVELRVASSSAVTRSNLALRLTGPRRVVGFDRVLHPVVTLSS